MKSTTPVSIGMSDYNDRKDARIKAQAAYAKKPESPKIGEKKTAAGRVVSFFKGIEPNSDENIEAYLTAVIRERNAVNQFKSIQKERAAARDAISDNNAQITSARIELGLWGRFKVGFKSFFGLALNENEKSLSDEIKQCQQENKIINNTIKRDLDRITFGSFFSAKSLNYGTADEEAGYKLAKTSSKVAKLKKGITSPPSPQISGSETIEELQEKLKQFRSDSFAKEYVKFEDKAAASLSNAEKLGAEIALLRSERSLAGTAEGLRKVNDIRATETPPRPKTTLAGIRKELESKTTPYFAANREKNKDKAALKAFEEKIVKAELEVGVVKKAAQDYKATIVVATPVLDPTTQQTQTSSTATNPTNQVPAPAADPNLENKAPAVPTQQTQAPATPDSVVEETKANPTITQQALSTAENQDAERAKRVARFDNKSPAPAATPAPATPAPVPASATNQTPAQISQNITPTRQLPIENLQQEVREARLRKFDASQATSLPNNQTPQTTNPPQNPLPSAAKAPDLIQTSATNQATPTQQSPQAQTPTPKTEQSPVSATPQSTKAITSTDSPRPMKMDDVGVRGTKWTDRFESKSNGTHQEVAAANQARFQGGSGAAI